MADTIFKTVSPSLKAVDNGDGTYSMAMALAGLSTIGDGRKIVAAATVRETLVASTTPCKQVTITAETDNDDVVVLGGSTVIALLATRRGTPLYAGDSVTIPIDDLYKIYLDVLVSGDGVTYSFLV